MEALPEFFGTGLEEGRGLVAASRVRYGVPFRRGTLEIGLYAPRGSDPQQPHTRDEVYVVVQGNGVFEAAGERKQFAAGDVLFVAAGVAHRFHDISEELRLIVVFAPPEGSLAGASTSTEPAAT